MENKLKIIVEAYLKKAHKELQTAKFLFKKGLYDKTISCCYYCVFNGAKAALESKNISTSSHKQTTIQLHLHFIKENRNNESLGEILKDLSEDRNLADYDVMWDSDKERAQTAIQDATHFLSSIEKLLSKNP